MARKLTAADIRTLITLAHNHEPMNCICMRFAIGEDVVNHYAGNPFEFSKYGSDETVVAERTQEWFEKRIKELCPTLQIIAWSDSTPGSPGKLKAQYYFGIDHTNPTKSFTIGTQTFPGERLTDESYDRESLAREIYEALARKYPQKALALQKQDRQTKKGKDQ